MTGPMASFQNMMGPELVAVDVTSRCASRCKKCYVRRLRGTGMDMSAEVFAALMRSLWKLGASVNVLLGTGEALLVPRYLLDLIAWSNETGANIELLTTGFLLTPKNIALLADAENLSVQVTLDGMEQEEIDQVQKLRIDRVKARVRLASEQLSIKLNYTLYNHNVKSLPRLVEFAHECGISEVFVTALKVFDVCWADVSPYAVDIAERDVQEKLEECAALADATGVGFHYRVARETSCISDYRWARYCSDTGFFRPIVREDGWVSLCWGREDLVLGPLPAVDLADILHSRSRLASLRLLSQGQLPWFCQSCLKRYNCGQDVPKAPQQEPVRIPTEFMVPGTSDGLAETPIQPDSRS